MAFLGFVRTRLESLECLRASGTPLPSLEKAMTSVVQTVAQQLSSIPGLTYDGALAIMQLIQTSPLTATCQQALIDCVQEKTGTIGNDSPSSEKKQDHQYFHEYLRKGHDGVEYVFGPKGDTSLRLRFFARLARSMGLNYPNSDTKARITACAFPGAKENEGHVLELEGGGGYDAMDLFRKVFAEVPITNPGRDILSFPPFDKLSEYPGMVASMGFVNTLQCPPLFDAKTTEGIIYIGKLIPCRNTRTTVKRSASSSVSALPPGRRESRLHRQMSSGMQSAGTTP